VRSSAPGTCNCAPCDDLRNFAAPLVSSRNRRFAIEPLLMVALICSRQATKKKIARSEAGNDEVA
jgi:hypothetical protein